MNSLLTTVSGYFSRSLILGAFLPAVIAVAAFALLVFPYVPEKTPLLATLAALETEWKIVSASFATIILSGLIHNLNTLLIRIYEGYPWQKTKFGIWKTNRRTDEYRKLHFRRQGMRAALLAMNRAEENERENILREAARYLDAQIVPAEIKNDYSSVTGDAETTEAKWKAVYAAILSRWTALNRFLTDNYPYKESLMLPTRLGNVIRSFEVYSLREYGMDSIVLYTRLISKMDKDFAVIIDEAKTSFDFMINCSVLAVLLIAGMIFTGTYYGEIFGSAYSLAAFFLKVFLLSIISYLAYLGAVKRAFDWGESVKSGFDLYRNDLLKQLGFSHTPPTKREERIMWENISRQMLDGDSLKGPRIDYAEAAVSYPALISGDVKLSILRGVNKSFSRLKVVITVTNSNDDRRPAENVAVLDKLPVNWFYRAGTAKLNNITKNNSEPVNITGSNPYRFEIGNFEYNEQKKIVFEITNLPAEAT